jgi:hypothetical protein
VLIKPIIAFFFLLAFATLAFNKYFVMADYQINTAAYAKNCINKAKPRMHCNGKCQMIKKIQQEEKKDQQDPDRKGENKFNILLSKTFLTIVPFCGTHFIKKRYPISPAAKETKRSFEIFHPPSC